MSKYALLIDYDYCTGCHSCEVACQQEHDFPAGYMGMVVTEHVLDNPGTNRLSIFNVPFPTQLCDLCAERVAQDKKPSCVHHCQVRCLEYGTLSELAQKLENKTRAALFAPC